MAVLYVVVMQVLRLVLLRRPNLMALMAQRQRPQLLTMSMIISAVGTAGHGISLCLIN
ncbi:hypothetical protein OK016_11120 [Vibrio chagasii]|nr:hypothetical protein [Vibrio chagasii]